MRCIFLVEDYPISPDAPGGAPAIFYNHLEMLAEYGADISLVVLGGNGRSQGFERFMDEQPDVWRRVRSWCSDFELIRPEYLSRKQYPLSFLRSVMRSPNTLYGVVDILAPKSRYYLRALVEDKKSGLIWAEHLIPAALVRQFSIRQPFVYVHHDWLWRIKVHRAATEKPKRLRWLKTFLKRRAEETLVRQAAACISASSSEANEIARLSGKLVGYFPTLYEPVTVPSETPVDMRVVHLGGMGTTANRIGLERFMDRVWPRVNSKPALWVIGSLTGASNSLLQALNTAGAECTGFVPDLNTVMRPYDVHIIPWEFNTGTRTRIPLAMNYAQVVVSTKAAAACLPEITNGYDCILTDTLDEMPSILAELLANPEKRRLLGNRGRETFMQHYTRPAVQNRFNAFVDAVLKDQAKSGRS